MTKNHTVGKRFSDEDAKKAGRTATLAGFRFFADKNSKAVL